MKLLHPGHPGFTPPPTETRARLAPGAPQWASDTGPSWNPATWLDGMGNYGGPIGTSGPMGAGGGDRGDAANIANGLTKPDEPMQPTPYPSQDRWLPDGSGVLGMQQPPPTQPPISGMNFNPTTNSYNPTTTPQFSGGQNNAATATPLPQQSPTLPPQIGQQKFGDSGIGSLGGGGGQANVSLNLQGSATMNPQGANQNRGYPGMNFASTQQQDQSRGTMMFAEGGPTQQGVGSLDRGRTGIREIDIIRTYLVHLGMKPEQVPQMIQAVVKDGAKFSRIGNTMMSMKPISQNAAQVYFYTVSKMPEFMDDVKGFINKLKQSGISVIYMNREDRDIMQAIQAAGASVQQSDRPEFKIMAGI